MEIVFAGICCWVDTMPSRTGKTVIIRNALGGGTHNSIPIPPHHAFIHAKRGQVDSADWTSDWSGGEDNLLFYLSGDYVTFDPLPSGGSIDLKLVPHVFASSDDDPICPAAEQVRKGFLVDPHPHNVLALVNVPANADVVGEANTNNAIFVTMRMPSVPVTITATSFDGSGRSRSLTVTDSNARVFIANVTLSEYLTGIGASDDSHRHLVCEIFKPKALRRATARSAGLAGAANGTQHSVALSLDHISLTTLRRAARWSMTDFLDSLAAGCSNSQWP